MTWMLRTLLFPFLRQNPLALIQDVYSQTNVEGAQAELLKYYNMVSGNRGLIIKIFLVLILVIFLFVVVF
jgi:hypothetical protein